VEDALDQGAEALLTKPFSIHELTGLISRLALKPEERWQDEASHVGLNLQVTLNANESAEGRINIARGGMFVALDANLPKVLDRVHFKFQFQGDHIPPLEGVGLVRWVRKEARPGYPKGVGIEFVSIPDGPRARLLKMVNLKEAKAFIPNSLP